MLLDKSKEAFDVLYEKYSPTLYGIVLKIVVSEEAAQDVLQDSFIKIWNNIAKYDRSKGALFTWLLNITRNTAIDYTRSKHVKNKIQMDEEIVSSMGNVEMEMKNFDYIGVKEAVITLKPEYKNVIQLLYFLGYTQEEAAKELNLPLGTLKTRARAALKILRETLKDPII